MRVIITLLIICGVAWSQTAKIERSRRIGFEGQILAKIFSDYDPYTRPPVRDLAEHSSIIIYLSLHISRVVWQATNNVELDLYLRQEWQDGRLIYEVDSRERINEVSVPMNKKIWTPDTYFSNAVDRQYNNRRRVVIEPEGFVRSSEMRTVTVPFLYSSKHPLDNSRTFKLKISSYNYPLEDVIYQWVNLPPVEISEELNDKQFEFIESEVGECLGNYTVGAYSCIEVVLTFTGSTGESLIRLFLPSVLLLIVSWLHFWIHGSWSVPRTISAAIPFFIFAVLLIFYSQPHIGSDGLNPAHIWLIFCTLLTFASFVEYFIVICCGIRRIIRYKDEKHDDESPLTVTRETMEIPTDTKCANFKHNNGIDIISRIAFPIIFLVFLIVFLVLYLI